MSEIEENNISEIVVIKEENIKEESWSWSTPCSRSYWWCSRDKKRDHQCSYSFAILVNINKHELPPRLIFENYDNNKKGWITLKNNLNLFCWCCDTERNLYLLYDRTKLKRYIYGNKVTLVYPSPNYTFKSINLKNYKQSQLNRSYFGLKIPPWASYSYVSPPLNDTHWRQKTGHRITHVSILCKSNEPPSLLNLCKIAFWTKYLVGKYQREFLPYRFRISNDKFPRSLNLDLDLITRHEIYIP